MQRYRELILYQFLKIRLQFLMRWERILQFEQEDCVVKFYRISITTIAQI
ncbi:hypothetical protein PCC7424_0787 [Gloeothece citriformis PCC 7424]|uniref:Uncharacterized protein n=1 Tax=Gloeothece citriformis (strain PCC 7424) TaxID=65393 RepID=B7KH34_GLOC7|nr:hypothetical protein PCC7424_0787 [Gloeothece citriformis PCC 7424]